jgi:hypothetical protein
MPWRTCILACAAAVLGAGCSDDTDHAVVRLACDIPAPNGADDRDGSVLVGNESFLVLDGAREAALRECTARIEASVADACDDSPTVELHVEIDDGLDDEAVRQFRSVECPSATSTTR